MTILGEDIMTKVAVKYLGITLDTKLKFFAYIKTASDKAARVTTGLSGLIFNMSGVTEQKAAAYVGRLLDPLVRC